MKNIFKNPINMKKIKTLLRKIYIFSNIFMLPLNKLYYLFAIKLFKTIFKNDNYIVSTYLINGMLEDFYPGDSDIDFAIIVKSDVPKEFFKKFKKKFNVIRLFFPFYSYYKDLLFITDSGFEKYFNFLTEIFDDSFERNIINWKLVFGKEIIKEYEVNSESQINKSLSKWLFGLMQNEMNKDFRNQGQNLKYFNYIFIRKYHKYFIRTLKFIYRLNNSGILSESEIIEFFSKKYGEFRKDILELYMLKDKNYFLRCNFEDFISKVIFILNHILEKETLNKYIIDSKEKESEKFCKSHKNLLISDKITFEEFKDLFLKLIKQKNIFVFSYRAFYLKEKYLLPISGNIKLNLLLLSRESEECFNLRTDLFEKDKKKTLNKIKKNKSMFGKTNKNKDYLKKQNLSRRMEQKQDREKLYERITIINDLDNIQSKR